MVWVRLTIVVFVVGNSVVVFSGELCNGIVGVESKSVCVSESELCSA
jgi:hypothetical protein